MYRLLIYSLVASELASAAHATGVRLCYPKLAVTDVQFSAMMPPTLERKWTATVTVDASRCAASSGGAFEIGFRLLKETAPDLDFKERFTWRPPMVKVAVDFAFDEAAQGFWLENVTSCICRK